MVGNSIGDDACAAELGCEVFIVDDMLEGEREKLADYRHGSFDEFAAFAAALPDISR